MRRNIGFVIMICLMFLTMIACQNQSKEEERVGLPNEEFWEMEDQGIVDRGWYGSFMRFENNLVWISGRWTDFARYNGRDVVFVHSEEDAVSIGHPLDVIVGWPSAYSLGIIEGINRSDEIDLEAFGLSYPLTAADLVDNWKVLYEMLVRGPMSASDEIVDEIRRHAEENYGEEASTNWDIRGWLFPGALEGLNELIEGRDIKEIDLTRFNEIYNREATIDELPTWPITEEDVRQDPLLVTQIALRLLTSEELGSIEPENLLRAQQEAEE